MKGSLAAGDDLLYDTLMVSRSTRSRPNTGCSRGGELSGRLFLGDLPVARRSGMARRQAGHAEDVIFSIDAFKKHNPATRPTTAMS